MDIHYNLPPDVTEREIGAQLTPYVAGYELCDASEAEEAETPHPQCILCGVPLPNHNPRFHRNAICTVCMGVSSPDTRYEFLHALGFTAQKMSP